MKGRGAGRGMATRSSGMAAIALCTAWQTLILLATSNDTTQLKKYGCR